jgi:hypothetical protein
VDWYCVLHNLCSRNDKCSFLPNWNSFRLINVLGHAFGMGRGVPESPKGRMVAVSQLSVDHSIMRCCHTTRLSHPSAIHHIRNVSLVSRFNVNRRGEGKKQIKTYLFGMRLYHVLFHWMVIWTVSLGSDNGSWQSRLGNIVSNWTGSRMITYLNNVFFSISERVSVY